MEVGVSAVEPKSRCERVLKKVNRFMGWSHTSRPEWFVLRYSHARLNNQRPLEGSVVMDILQTDLIIDRSFALIDRLE